MVGIWRNKFTFIIMYVSWQKMESFSVVFLSTFKVFSFSFFHALFCLKILGFSTVCREEETARKMMIVPKDGCVVWRYIACEKDIMQNMVEKNKIKIRKKSRSLSRSHGFLYGNG